MSSSSRVFPLRRATIIVASLLAVSLPGLAQPIQAGIDCWTTPAGSTSLDLMPNPIPADFFGPGSDPFTGFVEFQGAPLSTTLTSPPIGMTDTIVRRLAPMNLGPEPSSVQVPIEIVALNLVSVQPIAVTFNGGQNPQLWDVQVCLSDVPQQQGQMFVNKTHANGGSFNSILPVTPKLIFTPTVGPPTILVLDFGLVGGTDFLQGHSPWVSAADPHLHLIDIPPGVSVDANCNGVFGPPLPGTSGNFHPGVEETPASPCNPGSGPQRKVLTVEQGLLAAHGVLPVCECPGTTGVPGLNDHTINGQGSAACSCPRAFVPAGGGTLEFGATCPPSALIIGAFAGSCAPGAATIDPSVPYTLDLDPFSLGFLFDGTGWLLPPGPLTPFFKSDPAGNFSLALTATLPPGPLFVSQFAFVHPAFPLGIGTSQAIEIVASDDPCLVGTDLGLGDDTSAAIALGVPVTYYGHTYAEIFVNANGNLTFCAGDSDFTASVGEFLGTSSVLSGLPRIAPAWRDWSPNIAGSVMAFNGPSRFGVCYERVPSFGCGVDDPNTFVVTIDKLSDEITFCYGVMSLCGGTELDNIIVGLSPGFDIAGLCPPGPLTPVASTSTNLYPATPAGVGPYGALFELFSPGTTIDFPVGHLEVFVPIPGPTYSNVTP